MNINYPINCIQLIHKFDNLFVNHIYKNDANITDLMRSVTIGYYDFILDMWKRKDYSIFSNFTLKKILKSRDYIKKNNIIVYENHTKKLILFPDYSKIDVSES